MINPEDCRTVEQCMEAMKKIPLELPSVVFDMYAEGFSERMDEIISFRNRILFSEGSTAVLYGDGLSDGDP